MYFGKTDILNPEGPWLKFHQRMLVLCTFICYWLTCSNFLFQKLILLVTQRSFLVFLVTKGEGEWKKHVR